MNVTRPSVFVTLVACAALAPFLAGAQQPARADSGAVVARLVAEPTSLTLRAGSAGPLEVTAYDAQGRIVDPVRLRISAPRGALTVREGTVRARQAGRYEIVVTAVDTRANGPVVLKIPVTVTWPAISSVAVKPEP